MHTLKEIIVPSRGDYDGGVGGRLLPDVGRAGLRRRQRGISPFHSLPCAAAGAQGHPPRIPLPTACGHAVGQGNARRQLGRNRSNACGGRQPSADNRAGRKSYFLLKPWCCPLEFGLGSEGPQVECS